MEGLPDDVILIILRKLALQDPSSLLQATKACKSFSQTAEENVGLWKEAFSNIVLGDHSKDERIEAHLISVGGYKRLIEARWDNCTDSKYEQTQDHTVSFKDLTSSWNPSTPTAILRLVVLREGKKLLFIWGLLTEQMAPCHLRQLGDFVAVGARMPTTSSCV